MLCPYYELALANRFPRKIEAEVLNLVFGLKEADFASRVSKGRPKHGKKRPASDGQTLLKIAEGADQADGNVVQEYDCDAE